MTTTSKLEEQLWRNYFDHVSKTLEGKRVEIEIDSLSIGSQIEAQWLPLLGLTYDPKNDMIEILAEGLDHMIHKPRDVYIEQNGPELLSMEVIDGDNVKQVIQFRDPLMLPPS